MRGALGPCATSTGWRRTRTRSGGCSPTPGSTSISPKACLTWRRTDVHITDRAPIVRPARGRRRAGDPPLELAQRRRQAALQFKSDGRTFDQRRCLAIADGFYEYTAPADPKAKRKDRWLFRPVEGELIGIAAIWRDHPEVGEAFTLLTGLPGEDVKPYHHRQIVLVPPQRWAQWLDPACPAATSWSRRLRDFSAWRRRRWPSRALPFAAFDVEARASRSLENRMARPVRAAVAVR